MAVTSVTTSALVFADVYRDKVVKSIQHAAVPLALFPKVPLLGKQVKWVVDGYGSSAAYYAEGADFGSPTARTYLDATLPIAEITANRQLSGLAGRVASASMSPGGERDQIGRLVQSAADDIAEQIATDFYVGLSSASPMGIIGLQSAISDSVTYAGINRLSTDGDPFKGTVVDEGAVTITLDKLQSDLNKIRKRCNRYPDVAMCSFETFSQIQSAINGKLQFTMPLDGSIGSLAAQVGVQSVVVNGCTFVPDAKCPAGQIFYLNSEAVEWNILSPGINSPDGLVKVEAEGYNGQPLPLGMMFLPIGKTGDSNKFQMIMNLQLAVTRPAMCGLRKNVNE